MLQRLAQIPVIEVPTLMADGTLHPEAFYHVMGFASSDEGIAILARASQRQVVNVAQRGGMAAVMVVEEAGAAGQRGGGARSSESRPWSCPTAPPPRCPATPAPRRRPPSRSTPPAPAGPAPPPSPCCAPPPAARTPARPGPGNGAVSFCDWCLKIAWILSRSSSWESGTSQVASVTGHSCQAPR